MVKAVGDVCFVVLPEEACATIDALSDTLEEEEVRHAQGELTMQEFLVLRGELFSIADGARAAELAELNRRCTDRK